MNDVNVTCTLKELLSQILLVKLHRKESGLSRPKLEIIRTSESREVSPLLPKMILNLGFRIQWTLWRLSGIDLLAIVKWYTRSTSFLEH